LIILITFGEEHRFGSSLCRVHHSRNYSVKNNILPELQNIISLCHSNIFL
jgi:hypothetical protein